MTWFYTICVAAIAILIADAKGTLEPAVNKFEEKIGIYTPPPDSTESDTLRYESGS
jgi:hypothetical protein